MAKPVIAVDCDEVLLPLHEPFLRHHNDAYGTDYAYPNNEGKYYLHEFTGETHDVIMAKLEAFVATPSFVALEPIPGAVTAIKALAERYELFVVTARQVFMEAATEQALRIFFGDSFSAVEYAPFNGVNHSSKLEICRQKGADYLIDDNLSTALQCADGGIEAVLFGDYPWNKADTLPAGVTRCTNWPAVLEHFNGR